MRHAIQSFVLLALAAPALADDWPQWRGPQRDGVWRETGIVEKFPPTGPPRVWSVRIGAGYSGPAVAHGRVFVSDRKLGPEVERVLCFDEITGKLLWSHVYPVDYNELEYGAGPRATPTVAAGKVYTLGALGHLFCLDAADGKIHWAKDLVKEYQARLPYWGISAAPLIEGSLLVVCAGGQPAACVVAFDKNTGKEAWKALKDRPSYSAPVIVEAAKQRQLLVWTPEGLNALAPTTGELLWKQPAKMPDDYQIIATPAVHKDLVLLTTSTRGSKLLKLTQDKPGAEVVWQNRDEPNTSMMTPAFLDAGHVAVVSNAGDLGCFDLAAGNPLWKTRDATGKLKWGMNAHVTLNDDRAFLFNQKGKLILASLTTKGYREIGRTLLVEATTGTRGERPITWAHPAYANRHVFARNDKELVRVNLSANAKPEGEQREPSGSLQVKEIAALAPGKMVGTVAVSPDGKHLALGDSDGGLQVLDSVNHKPRFTPTLKRSEICAVAFSVDSQLLAVGGGSTFRKQGDLTLFDVAQRKELKKLTGHANRVLAVAFSPDGKLLASAGDDNLIKLWELPDGKERATLKGHADAVAALAFSPDSRTLASASWDRTVKLWDVKTGEPRTLQGHDDEVLAAAFSPDGKTLATGSGDRTIRLWDPATGTQHTRHEGHQGAVYALAFSTDGKWLGSGSGDETARLWDAAGGKTLVILRGFGGLVSALAFAPTGQMLTVCPEESVKSWKIGP